MNGGAGAKELLTFLSTKEGVYGSADSKTEVPRSTLVQALKAGSTLTDTEAFDAGTVSRAVDVDLS